MNTSQFYHLCDDKHKWTYVLSQYDDAIKLLSTNKKKPNLLELDKFWRFTLPYQVSNRVDLKVSSSSMKSEDLYVTLEEISKIMTWKITRCIIIIFLAVCN